jgi:hypothetical protein
LHQYPVTKTKVINHHGSKTRKLLASKANGNQYHGSGKYCHIVVTLDDNHNSYSHNILKKEQLIENGKRLSNMTIRPPDL